MIPKHAKIICRVSYDKLDATPLVSSGPVSEHDKKIIKKAFELAGIDERKPIGNAGYEKASNSHVFFQPNEKP